VVCDLGNATQYSPGDWLHFHFALADNLNVDVNLVEARVRDDNADTVYADFFTISPLLQSGCTGGQLLQLDSESEAGLCTTECADRYLSWSDVNHAAASIYPKVAPFGFNSAGRLIARTEIVPTYRSALKCDPGAF